MQKVTAFLRKWWKLEFVIILAVIAFFLAIYFVIFYKLPSPYSLKESRHSPLSTHIYDRNGKLLYEFFRNENRTAIKIEDLPKFIPDATVSIEDKDFYKHKGVSIFSGVLRAAREIVLRRSFQGGSTITQQLVKSALLTSERTVVRKIKEIILALWTERIFTKNEILELYINQVPYGGSSYGVEEASRIYFGKHAKDINLSQAALLAGLPQAPSLYSPYVNPDLTKRRRDEVLQKMYEQGYIKKEQMEKAKSDPIKVIPPKTNINAPHFVFYVKSLLEQIYGTQTVEEGGLKVTTTLDLNIQKEAEKILKEELEKVQNLNVGNGAILVTRPSTGEILAMVGSNDYFASPSGAFNVTTALRQPGSSIKPLNFAVGLDRQLVTPATVFIDSATCFTGGPRQYCPVNYDGQFHGLTQLRFALGNSYNIPAVKMLAINGVETFIASASAFTISTFTDPSRYGLSLTLGGGEVRMTEMAQAFSAFANWGKAKKLNTFLKVQNADGRTLYENDDPNYVKDITKSVPNPNFLAIQGIKAITKEAAFLISHILLDNNARSSAFGTSSLLVIPGKAVSVKTGTTDDKKDNWTIGYTPNFLTAVWVGNNDNTPMNPYLTSGVTGAAPIWNRVMRYILRNQLDLWPLKPDTVIGKQVCFDTGAIATKDGEGKESCPARFEYFIKGTENQATNVSRQVVPVTKDDKLAKPNDADIEMKEKTVIKDKYSTYCVDCAH